MGKRRSISYPAVRVELEDVEDTALRSSKRRALQFASNSVAMTLLALRTEPPRACSEETFPLNEPLCPLPPQQQVNAVKYSVSSITDDEDENETDKVVASKKRPEVIQVGPSLATIALRKPNLYTAGTRGREVPNHQQLPFARSSLPPASFGRPLPRAPLLPSLLLTRRVIPSTYEGTEVKAV
jgi:hypothetical protein